jgi:hypothetical protein
LEISFKISGEPPPYVEKGTPGGEEVDSHPSECGVREPEPVQTEEKVERPPDKQKDPNTAKSGRKKPGPNKNKSEPEPTQAWVTKGGQAPSTSKKMSIPLRAVAKEPRKEARKTPKKQADEILHEQEKPQKREMEDP